MRCFPVSVKTGGQGDIFSKKNENLSPQTHKQLLISLIITMNLGTRTPFESPHPDDTRILNLLNEIENTTDEQEENVLISSLHEILESSPEAYAKKARAVIKKTIYEPILSNSIGVEGIYNDTFMIFVGNASMFLGLCRLSTYLCRIAYFTTLNEVRRVKKYGLRNHDAENEYHEQSQINTPDDMLEYYNKIIAAIKELDDKKLSAGLIMFYVDKLTDREIVEKLDGPHDNLDRAAERFKKRRQRAIETLRAQFT